MFSFRLRILLLAGLTFLARPSFGQTTITYLSGTTDSTSYSTTPPDGPLTLSIASGTATQSGALTGTGGIIKEGAGSLTLSGSNGYEGGTVLNAGTLRLGDFDSLGSGSVTITGGALGNATPDDVVAVENNFAVEADFAMDVQGVAGAVEIFGNVNLGAAATRTLSLTAEGLACFGGEISGQGFTILAVNGPSQAMFCNNISNVFTGTLRVGADVTLELWKVEEGIVAVSGDMVVDQGAAVVLLNAEQFATTSNVEIQGTLLGMSAGRNTINALSGTGSIIGADGDTLAINSGTFSGSITEGQVIVKQGAGTLALTGSSSYTGGTTVASGTLRAGHARALGEGDVAVEGDGVLWVEEGIALEVGAGKIITLENNGTATYRKDFALEEDLASFGEIVSSGSNATVASILSGTASAAGSVEAWFDDEPSTPASNDEFRVSDVLGLDGLAGETFVMQLSYSQAAYDAAQLAGLYTSETQLLIGTYDGASWVAVGTGPFVNGAWTGEMALGTYGVDTANNVVWVVTYHNSDFAVVPEPSISALLILAGLGALVRRRQGTRSPAARLAAERPHSRP